MPAEEAVSARTARRVLLRLQGLGADCAEDAPGGARSRSGAVAVSALVERLGYVQIDSINVIERAHHLILGARLVGYRHDHLKHALERDRTLFEHWTHDACAIPTRWYPHWHHRFERFEKKIRRHAWWKERFGGSPQKVFASVLARISKEGALRARDFLPPGEKRGEPGGWWNWHPEKAALEFLWRSGRLAVVGRDRFEKRYDLPERVHAEWHGAARTSHEEHVDWACRSALERLGFATEREIAHFWNAVSSAEVRKWATQALADGDLERVSVESANGAKPARCLRLADGAGSSNESVEAEPARARRSKRRGPEAAGEADEIIALAPFDPIVRDRARALRLFDFDYRFEAFTPAAKRKYGYYVMPLLEGDRIIGRIDPKFDRENGVLLVRGPWWEPGVKPDRARRARLETALGKLTERIGAESVEMVARSFATRD